MSVLLVTPLHFLAAPGISGTLWYAVSQPKTGKRTFEVAEGHTYIYIMCNQLPSRIQRINTRMRQATSLQKQLAVMLRSLGTPAEYRFIGHIFGIAKLTVCIIVHDTCKAIIVVFLHHFSSRR